MTLGCEKSESFCIPLLSSLLLRRQVMLLVYIYYNKTGKLRLHPVIFCYYTSNPLKYTAVRYLAMGKISHNQRNRIRERIRDNCFEYCSQITVLLRLCFLTLIMHQLSQHGHRSKPDFRCSAYKFQVNLRVGLIAEWCGTAASNYTIQSGSV